jgi:hypothetical protein
MFIKKCFLFVFGSVRRVKGFRLGDKLFADDEEVESVARKWLRQQSNTSVLRVLGALVRRWDQCINVGGGCVEK